MGYKVISAEVSTKELLEKTVLELMAEKGENFTVRDICKRAGVSIGTFYTYYKNKDAAVLMRLRIMDDHLLTVYETCPDSSYAVRLKSFLDSYIESSILYGYVATREQYRSVLMAEMPLKESEQRPLYKLTKSLIKDGQSAGEFTAAHTSDFLTNATIAFIRGLVYNWCHQGGTYELLEPAKEATSLWIDGLKRHDG